MRVDVKRDRISFTLLVSMLKSRTSDTYSSAHTYIQSAIMNLITYSESRLGDIE